MTGVLRAVASSASKIPRCFTSSSKRELSALLTPTEEFPDLPVATPEQSSASTARVTTLSNGLTVISENSKKTTTLSLTFPNAGTSSERPDEIGAALINKYLSFMSGSGLSTAVILRNLEDGGIGAPFSTVDRFGATVGFTTSRDEAVRFLPLLATTSSFEKWDVKDAKRNAKIAVEDATSNVETVLSESIFAAACGGLSPAGKPIYSEVQPSLSSIQSFRNRGYVLNGAVLSATGITDHDEFINVVEHGFSESLVGGSSGDAPSAEFTGGEERIHAPGSGYAHMVLAFNGPSSNSALAQVVSSYIDIVNASSTASGFTSPIGSGGVGGNLIGVYSGAVPAADAASALDAICSSLTAVPSADVVDRAKILAKANAMFKIEDGSRNLADAMTAYVLEQGEGGVESLNPGDFISIDAITAKDVEGVFQGMLKGPLALSAVGDITSVPYLGSVASRFG